MVVLACAWLPFFSLFRLHEAQLWCRAGEFEPHVGCWMGWPESDDSQYLWREGGEPARQVSISFSVGVRVWSESETCHPCQHKARHKLMC